MSIKRANARHIRWQVIIIACGVALLATLLIYVALSFSTSTFPAQGGTYIEGMVGQPHAINPLLCSVNRVDRDLCSLVFNGLLRLDAHGLPQPDLAARPPEIMPIFTVVGPRTGSDGSGRRRRSCRMSSSFSIADSPRCG